MFVLEIVAIACQAALLRSFDKELNEKVVTMSEKKGGTFNIPNEQCQ